MKAIVCRRYGSPRGLELQEMEKGPALEKEVLVRVRASSVNALDWHVVRGSPVLVRLTGGLRRPKRPRVGSDFAGVVEAVGPNATEFHVGEEVFGVAYGSFGEYVSAAESEIVLKPGAVSDEAAASLPIAASTALQALRDLGQVRPGQKVLINGAAGGVGTFAVQLAKHFGAEVTAVTSAGNLELVRSLGADRAIDYDQEDFTRGAVRYDLILDLHPNRPSRAYRRVLGPQGTCVVLGFGGLLRLAGLVVRARLSSKTKRPRVVFMVAKIRKADLKALGELVGSGAFAPVIDRRYPLAQVPEALEYVEAGHARGKVVISLEGASPV